ncbi:MAG TPA: M15 family metallopeptidase [Geobacteraceae bacterium]|nr:M15 family metallopeptidase [Geobacteraceae bacterium]
MKLRNLVWLVFLVLSAGLLPGIAMGGEQPEQLPSGFVYVDTVIPDIRIELRYATTHNFVGERIDGYLQPRCILTREAAVALRQVQEELRPFGLGLKVFDAYRPQRAVDHFVRWARDPGATRTKGEFYPVVSKEKLFEEEYISDRSGHSRGSTVDATIVPLQGEPPVRELDMGTGFDFFGPESWPLYARMAPYQRANRMLLQTVMKKHGFRPYAKEWWHFTLEHEPFPETYFNFPIR